MKILITGGAGFQGSHMAEHLLQGGHDVSILNTYSKNSIENISRIINDVNLIWGSVTDKNLVDKSVRGHDAVLHLAANINVDDSLEDPRSFLDVNIIGTYHILEAVKKNDARLLYASSCEVYGDGHDLGESELLDERSEFKPNSPYAASKAGADRLCGAYWRSFNTDVTIIRPFNIFGERQKDNAGGALIPILVRRAMNGENLIIFGDGSATRDFMHVSDLVRAYDAILNNDQLRGMAINFATGINTSVKHIVEYIAKRFDATIKHGPPRPGEVSRFPADLSLAKSLGFSPKVEIFEGIDRYIDWAKERVRAQNAA